MKFQLDNWQTTFLSTTGDKILCCGRQIGKSEICALDASAWAYDNPNQNILMIAPTERQAFALFDKTLAAIIENRPKMLQKKGKARPTKSRINLTNGVRIYCLPVGKSGLGVRFLTIGRLYGEEAARIPEMVWDAVRPCLLTTGGATVLLSTPAGSEGYFPDVFTNKGGVFNSFTRFAKDSKTVISERPICETWSLEKRTKALEFLEREKARMTALQYEQEYMGFISDKLHQFFSTDLIKSCMVSPTETPSMAVLQGDRFLGVDIARMGEDETVLASVSRVNRENIHLYDLEITEKTLLTETILRIQNADKRNNYRKIYIDSTGIGAGVYDVCLADPELRNKVVAMTAASKSLNRDGTQHKRLVKEDWYMNLKLLMEQQKIKLPDRTDILVSMKSVQYEVDPDTKDVKIFGNYTHISDAIAFASWCMTEKSLNLWCAY